MHRQLRENDAIEFPVGQSSRPVGLHQLGRFHVLIEGGQNTGTDRQSSQYRGSCGLMFRWKQAVETDGDGSGDGCDPDTGDGQPEIPVLEPNLTLGVEPLVAVAAKKRSTCKITTL